MGRKKVSAAVRLDDISDVEPDSDNESGGGAVDQQELSILNEIFKTNPKSPKYTSTLKYVFYASALFLVLSLPFTDRIIELAFPLSNSWLILVSAKTIAFFIAFYILMSSASKK